MRYCGLGTWDQGEEEASKADQDWWEIELAVPFDHFALLAALDLDFGQWDNISKEFGGIDLFLI